MVYIEMAAQREVEQKQVWGKHGGLADAPTLLLPRKNSYIWLLGNPWPIPQDEDPYILRIEAFGPELNYMDSGWISQRSMRSTEGHLLAWKFPDCSHVSVVMRDSCARGE